MSDHERYEHGVGPIYSVPLIDTLPLNPEQHSGMLQQMPSRQDLDVIHHQHDRIVAGYEVLLHHWRWQQAEIKQLRAQVSLLCPDCFTTQLRHDLAECRRLLRESPFGKGADDYMAWLNSVLHLLGMTYEEFVGDNEQAAGAAADEETHE